jgi:hypothetical protein
LSQRAVLQIAVDVRDLPDDRGVALAPVALRCFRIDAGARRAEKDPVLRPAQDAVSPPSTVIICPVT